ncbi:MAG: trypsin-like serine protease [Labilithrix sp.]
MKAHIALLALAALVTACTEPVAGDEEEGSSESSIVGGSTSTSLPSVGAVITFDSKGNYTTYCSSFLITSRIVMSAGHCGAHDGLPSFYTGGGVRLTNPPKTRADLKGFVEHKLKAKVVHAKYKGGTAESLKGTLSAVQGTMLNDFALYELAEPLTNVTPLQIAGTTPKSGDTCTAIGYGYDSEGTTIGAMQKREATVRVTTRSAQWLEVVKVNGEPAKGDSGSPLVCNGTVRGVLSFWYATDPKRPADDKDFYSNATGGDVRDFVNSTAKKWGVPGIN